MSRWLTVSEWQRRQRLKALVGANHPPQRPYVVYRREGPHRVVGPKPTLSDKAKDVLFWATIIGVGILAIEANLRGWQL